MKDYIGVSDRRARGESPGPLTHSERIARRWIQGDKVSSSIPFTFPLPPPPSPHPFPFSHTLRNPQKLEAKTQSFNTWFSQHIAGFILFYGSFVFMIAKITVWLFSGLLFTKNKHKFKNIQ
jgi:hypothetical protein